MYFIVRKTRRELQEHLAETAARSAQAGVRGELRRTEEAAEVQRRLERESGEEFRKPFAVAGDSPEGLQAEREIMERAGIRPEAVEEYQVSRARRERDGG